MGGSGTILGTSAITLDAGTALTIDNTNVPGLNTYTSSTNLANRVGDGTPITMSGATLSFIGGWVATGNTAATGGYGLNSSETIGTITLASGQNTIQSGFQFSYGAAAPTTLNASLPTPTVSLTSSSLVRSPGATVTFNGLAFELGREQPDRLHGPADPHRDRRQQQDPALRPGDRPDGGGRFRHPDRRRGPRHPLRHLRHERQRQQRRGRQRLQDDGQPDADGRPVAQRGLISGNNLTLTGTGGAAPSLTGGLAVAGTGDVVAVPTVALGTAEGTLLTCPAPPRRCIARSRARGPTA